MTDTQIIQYLKTEQTRLEGIIREAQKEFAASPEGSVFVKPHGKGVQFYYHDDLGETGARYLPVAERERAVALVQKRYLRRVLDAAERSRRVIALFLKCFRPDTLKKVFEREAAIRRPFLKPFEISDAEYTQRWQAVTYAGKPFPEDEAQHYTRKNERVRSKSEVLIADSLGHANIPYRYECPMELDGRTIYPDFTILRKADRKELIWEHLGMMDDAEYREKAFRRIREYERHGIFPGSGLILTMETAQMPLNKLEIDRVIGHYLDNP